MLVESVLSYIVGCYLLVGRYKWVFLGWCFGVCIVNMSLYLLLWMMCVWCILWGIKFVERVCWVWCLLFFMFFLWLWIFKLLCWWCWMWIDFFGIWLVVVVCWILLVWEEIYLLCIFVFFRFVLVMGILWRWGLVVVVFVVVVILLFWYCMLWMCDFLLGLGLGLC